MNGRRENLSAIAESCRPNSFASEPLSLESESRNNTFTKQPTPRSSKTNKHPHSCLDPNAMPPNFIRRPIVGIAAVAMMVLSARLFSEYARYGSKDSELGATPLRRRSRVNNQVFQASRNLAEPIDGATEASPVALTTETSRSPSTTPTKSPSQHPSTSPSQAPSANVSKSFLLCDHAVIYV